MTQPMTPADLTPEKLDMMNEAWKGMKQEFADLMGHYASWRALPESMMHPLIVDDALAAYLERLGDEEFEGQAQGLIMAAMDMLYDLAPQALRLAWAASEHSHE